MNPMLSLLVAFLFPLAALAQQAPSHPAPEQSRSSQERMRASMKKNRDAQKKLLPHFLARVTKVTDGEHSLPFVFAFENFGHEELVAYTGLSQEQVERFRKKQQEIGVQLGISIFSSLNRAAATDDPKRLEEIAHRRVAELEKLLATADDFFRKELAAEQLKKFEQLRLIKSTPNEQVEVMFDFGQYDLLQLTSEQRQRIIAIREAYTQEFLPLLDRLLDAEARGEERFIEKGVWDTTEEERAADRKAYEEALVPLMQLHARTRSGILAVLTKEQTAQIERIIAQAPKYLAKRINADAAKDHSWRDSWKPGDPIPEGAVPEQTGRIFPL